MGKEAPDLPTQVTAHDSRVGAGLPEDVTLRIVSAEVQALVSNMSGIP